MWHSYVYRYKWSFVNTDDALNLKQKEQFVPYLTKINNLLKVKYPPSSSSSSSKTTATNGTWAASNNKPGGPQLRQRKIQSLLELRGFFESMTAHSLVHNFNQGQQQTSTQPISNAYLKLFETSVHDDFLDGWA